MQRLRESAILHLARTFAPRDNMHRPSLVPSDHETIEESLAELDRLLMSAVGAFDALARLTHVLGRLPGKRRNAAWQHEEWVKKLGLAGPDYHALLQLADPSSSMMRTTLVSRLLRNTVHGESLQGIRQHAAPGPARGLVALPSDEAVPLQEALGHLGGADACGVEEIGGGLLVLEPGRFADRFIPAAAEQMDARSDNIRNGTRGKSVLTEASGQVEIELPRDRAGTFEPQIVKKRQRR